MEHKQQYREYHFRSAIQTRENLELLTTAAWHYAWSAIFWNHNYSEQEVIRIKKRIRSFLSIHHDPYQGYFEFCERIHLGVQYLYRYNKQDNPVNALYWLRPGTASGFQKTGKAYIRLLEKRKKLPEYCSHWKNLAEAVLDLHEEPFWERLNYWNDWFAERDVHFSTFILIHNVIVCITKNNDI